MNVFKGTIQGAGFHTEGGMVLPLGAAPPASEGRPAICGVRPEHFRLADDGIPVEVVVVEPTGSETQVVVKAGTSEITCVFRERIAARPGETIRVAPDVGLTHLFDTSDGSRLAA
jgi:multiple sugar transport system ATP-binding protein